MNRIKDSFSKIKASDEFKDKLLKELQANPVKLNSLNKNMYYKSHIAAASILFILIGIMSFKLIMNNFEKGVTNLESVAYSPETEPSTNKDSINENHEDNSNINISSSTTDDTIYSSTSEHTIFPSTTKNNIPAKKSENKLLNKSDVPVNIKALPKKTDSTNPVMDPNNTIPSSNNVVASSTNSVIASNNIVSSSNNEVMDSNNNGAISESRYINEDSPVNSLYIPKIPLPKANSVATAKMIPLVVYNGNIYLYTPIEISSENTRNLLGRKLGTTKGNTNEWSTQSDYSNRLDSNIGIADVYAVNGYDEDFRIMTNLKMKNGESYSEFYECLNGITIENGENILSKLKLQGNITQAKFQTFNDRNNGTKNFYTIDDYDLINNLFDEISKATPYLEEDANTSLGDYGNDDRYKEISFDLKDGSKNVTLTILKNGYVYYGHPRIYLKISSNFTEELWDKLSIMRIN